MANPVVHFEIIGKDAGKARQFYSSLFGWAIDANNPMNYGIVDNGGQGINGGIAGAENGDQPHTMFYVAVPDLQATLDQATSLGGKVLMPVTEIPNTVTLAVFQDPDGNAIGLIKDGM
ncbi:MAG TPA: VOC family protein [Dehalococcoidia bacterium]|nr:VOC family protein [Dehalococcoidia bacterium]